MKNRCCSEERTVFYPTVWGVCLSLASFITGCASPSNTAQRESANSDAPACCADPITGAPKPAAEIEKELARPKGSLQDQFTVSAWTQPWQRTQRFPEDIIFTTQAGKKIRAEDLRGRPVALSFIYTRCDNAGKCPLVAATIARLQRELEDAALSEEVQLALITYDPDYDSPAVLTKFGTTHGLCFDRNVLMLQPESKQKDRLFQELSVRVNYNKQSVNLHSIQLMLFDPQGRYVRTYHSVLWNNAQVLQDLKRLLGETKRAYNFQGCQSLPGVSFGESLISDSR